MENHAETDNHIVSSVQISQNQKNINTQRGQKNNEVINRKRKKLKRIKEKRKEYGQAMTIHGLSKVLEGKNSIEKIMWLLFITLGLTLAVFVTQQLWNEYFENKVSTIYTKYKHTSKQPWPTITYCDVLKYNSLMNSNMDAYIPQHNTTQDAQKAPKPMLYDEIYECSHDRETCLRGAIFGISINVVSKDYSSGGNHNELLSLEPGINTACATVNINGSMSSSMAGNNLAITILPAADYWGMFFINPPGERYYNTTPTVHWVRQEWYSLELKRTMVLKKGKPHSNCISASDGKN